MNSFSVVHRYINREAALGKGCERREYRSMEEKDLEQEMIRKLYLHVCMVHGSREPDPQNYKIHNK